MTVPQQVMEVEGDTARMQDGRWVKLSLVENVQVGDMLLVQANMAVEKVGKQLVKAMKETLLSSEDSE